MIDTISLLANFNESKPFNLSKLEGGEVRAKHKDGVIYNRGHLKNLFIRETPQGLFISGSIPKYLFNQNLFIPSLAQIESALNKIANELNFNLINTNVYRIDLGYNFKMNHNVKNYLSQFGDLERFTKMSVKDLETLTYSLGDKSKQLLFYHKIIEMKAKGVPIPSDYKDLDNYILRYELRLKRLKDQFGLDNINATMLYDKHFLSILIQKWYDSYVSIHKTKKIRFSRYAFKTPSIFRDALATIGLQSLGYDDVMNKVEMAKEHLSKANKNRIKKMIKNLSSQTFATYSYPLIHELNEKVEEVYNTYIANQS